MRIALNEAAIDLAIKEEQKAELVQSLGDRPGDCQIDRRLVSGPSSACSFPLSSCMNKQLLGHPKPSTLDGCGAPDRNVLYRTNGPNRQMAHGDRGVFLGLAPPPQHHNELHPT